MEIREAIQSDIDYLVAGNSTSRNCFDEQPEKIDFVYTLEHEGKILVVGGLRLLNLQTAWCWMDFTEDALKMKKSVYRAIRIWLDTFVKDMGIVRLMCPVKTDFQQAISMVEHLGFSREVLMKRFYGENDAYLYTKIDWSK